MLLDNSATLGGLLVHPVADFRSDTVTRPTPAMYAAMSGAELGDDVLGDDPTVQRLEALAAEMLGKEAGLFVASGTMGNLVAILTHTRPGDEVLLDRDSHSMRYEVGGPAAVAGVLTRQYPSTLGVPDVEVIRAEIHTPNLHAPGTGLLVLENTHNRSGGCIIPVEVHRELHAMAREKGVPIHLDGARLFNAAVASRVPVREFAACAESVSVCLSKALCCPAGSVLCGTSEFIEQARRHRKRIGGGMRQAGILAACGLVALRTMVDRLEQDHRLARALAEGLADLPGLRVDMASIQTNMVYVETAGDARQIRIKLTENNVLVIDVAPRTLRLVTHHDVDAEDVANAISAFRRCMTTKWAE